MSPVCEQSLRSILGRYRDEGLVVVFCETVALYAEKTLGALFAKAISPYASVVLSFSIVCQMWACRIVSSSLSYSCAAKVKTLLLIHKFFI